MDRSLTYKEHLKHTTMKVRTRNNIVSKHAGSSWGASFDVLRQTALMTVNSVADFGCPIWLNSSHVKRLWSI